MKYLKPFVFEGLFFVVLVSSKTLKVLGKNLSSWLQLKKTEEKADRDITNVSMGLEMKVSSYSLIWMLMTCLGLVFPLSCAAPEAPIPPSEDSPGNEDDGDDFGSDDDGDNEDNDDDSGGSYNVGGADNIWDPDTKKAIENCHDKMNYYDAKTDVCMDGSDGDKVELALMDCKSVSDLTPLASEDAINGAIKACKSDEFGGDCDDFEVDQCVDCPPGNSLDVCSDGGNQKEDYTKMTFAKKVGSEVRVFVLFSNKRPGRSSSDEE